MKLSLCHGLAKRLGQTCITVRTHLPCHGILHPHHVQLGDAIMGKYFLAWLLGVPAIVLVLIYFFFH
jgi:hypothetical protein